LVLLEVLLEVCWCSRSRLLRRIPAGMVCPSTSFGATFFNGDCHPMGSIAAKHLFFFEACWAVDARWKGVGPCRPLVDIGPLWRTLRGLIVTPVGVMDCLT